MDSGEGCRDNLGFHPASRAFTTRPRSSRHSGVSYTLVPPAPFLAALQIPAAARHAVRRPSGRSPGDAGTALRAR